MKIVNGGNFDEANNVVATFNGLTLRHGNLVVSANGRFLRHRFSPKSTNVATVNSLPKRNHVAKEAVSAAWQTRTRQRSERICKPNDAPMTKPWPSVKTMLCGGRYERHQKTIGSSTGAIADTGENQSSSNENREAIAARHESNPGQSS